MKLSNKFLNLLSNQERAELCDCDDLPFDNVVSAHCPVHGKELERREEEALAKHLRERAREEEEYMYYPDFPNEPWV